ncbi:DUF4255 domain-containing protein [Lysobacter sp. MMG2]|uniref:DUF4255 domain-containing protein n=1 Tax=Lysobacter sp. MMG2 TaxID=2801338 RepID=UPI001C24FE58|nr:DUF4255 domain-containing protein [Lysobacter sp. MMG2]MBU8974545.1 DUF4255 domain-containing protein [Lysobacter sp. MMG2]
MNADAILRVTQALGARLQQAVVASGDPGTVFIGPLDDQDAVGASLILFLYRIAPNASLRNREHRVAAQTPPPAVIVHENALPLDLYYLLTVGTRPGMSEEPLLRVLGFAMQALQAVPEITGSPVNQEVVRVTLEPLTTEETSRIWALFPTANYRTSVAYLASPVWIDPAQPPEQAQVVLEDSLDVGMRATVPVD